jgi:hypothetical protein
MKDEEMSCFTVLMADDTNDRFRTELYLLEFGWVTVTVCVVGFCSEIALGAHRFINEVSGMNPTTLSIISTHDV